MSEKRPTDSAKMHFGIAQMHSRMAHQIAAKDKGDDGVSVHLPLAVTADFPPWVGYGTL